MKFLVQVLISMATIVNVATINNT